MEALAPMFIDASEAKCRAMLTRERRRCEGCGTPLSVYHAESESLCWPCQDRRAVDPAQPPQPSGRLRPWPVRYIELTDIMRELGIFTGINLKIISRQNYDFVARALLQAEGEGCVVRSGNGKNSRYRWVGA